MRQYRVIYHAETIQLNDTPAQERYILGLLLLENTND